MNKTLKNLFFLTTFFSLSLVALGFDKNLLAGIEKIEETLGSGKSQQEIKDIARELKATYGLYYDIKSSFLHKNTLSPVQMRSVSSFASSTLRKPKSLKLNGMDVFSTSLYSMQRRESDEKLALKKHDQSIANILPGPESSYDLEEYENHLSHAYLYCSSYKSMDDFIKGRDPLYYGYAQQSSNLDWQGLQNHGQLLVEGRWLRKKGSVGSFFATTADPLDLLNACLREFKNNIYANDHLPEVAKGLVLSVSASEIFGHYPLFFYVKRWVETGGPKYERKKEQKLLWYSPSF